MNRRKPLRRLRSLGRRLGYKRPVGMGKGGEKLQAEYRAADLKHRTMDQGCICIRTAAGNGNPVDEHLTAEARSNEQAGSVLPGEIQMLGTDARTGNHQVTGAQRTEDTFPGNREPGIRRQFIASGENDEFTDRSGTGQVFKAVFTLFSVGKMPGEGKEQEHQGKKGKKPV